MAIWGRTPQTKYLTRNIQSLLQTISLSKNIKQYRRNRECLSTLSNTTPWSNTSSNWWLITSLIKVSKIGNRVGNVRLCCHGKILEWSNCTVMNEWSPFPLVSAQPWNVIEWVWEAIMEFGLVCRHSSHTFPECLGWIGVGGASSVWVGRSLSIPSRKRVAPRLQHLKCWKRC